MYYSDSGSGRLLTFTGRLETRAGAEEVIERLHGRMVRGWNDTGSRISVRFADTAEQRELRVRPCTEDVRLATDTNSSAKSVTCATAISLPPG